jgi:hypothetical protein
MITWLMAGRPLKRRNQRASGDLEFIEAVQYTADNLLSETSSDDVPLTHRVQCPV